MYPKTLTDSSFNASNRIALKFINNCEVELHRSIISRFLVESFIMERIADCLQKQ